MPVSIVVDDTRRRIDLRLYGAVSADDIAALIAYRREHDRVGHTLFVDSSESEGAPTPDEMRALAARRRRLYRADAVGPTAIVASGELLYGMLRMYQSLSDQTPVIYVARTRADAEAWLAARAHDAARGDDQTWRRET